VYIAISPQDVNFRFQQDARLLQDDLPHLFHQQNNIFRLGPASVDDEIGVLGRDHGLPLGQALESGVFNQSTCKITVRIFKKGTGRGNATGLLLLPPADNLSALIRYLLPITRFQGQHHGGDQCSLRGMLPWQLGGAVAKGDLIAGYLTDFTPAGHAPYRTYPLANGMPKGTGIHPHRAPDGTGNTGHKGKPGQPVSGTPTDNRRQTAARRNPNEDLIGVPLRLFDQRHVLNRAPQTNEDAAMTRGGHQNIGTAADHMPGNVFLR
jgi:hypothetical protein